MPPTAKAVQTLLGRRLRLSSVIGLADRHPNVTRVICLLGCQIPGKGNGCTQLKSKRASPPILPVMGRPVDTCLRWSATSGNALNIAALALRERVHVDQWRWF